MGNGIWWSAAAAALAFEAPGACYPFLVPALVFVSACLLFGLHKRMAQGLGVFGLLASPPGSP